MQRTNSSGVKSATSFQSGFPSDLDQRSHSAFTTAPRARWITPFWWVLVYSYNTEPLRGRSKCLRANPAQLGIGDEMPPGFAHVLSELFESSADNSGCDILNGFADDVISAADSECLRFFPNQLDCPNITIVDAK